MAIESVSTKINQVIKLHQAGFVFPKLASARAVAFLGITAFTWARPAVFGWLEASINKATVAV